MYRILVLVLVVTGARRNWCSSSSLWVVVICAMNTIIVGVVATESIALVVAVIGIVTVGKGLDLSLSPLYVIVHKLR
ncbi:hypothetical protein C2G38_2234874 [Gigaspora rosea]|uniref:Uncharacterized protein n=1 Tax=Gigaspora rosea TaxID=44941 RepID=A0A397TTL9_9GLOM|nr:hypothetical protein C2G38_2234874 [Gigaspora rosea]